MEHQKHLGDSSVEKHHVIVDGAGVFQQFDPS